ncbi:MAG: hypothetical protein WCX61_00075 [Candidatus Peribacteraceae bacterium]
MDSKKPVEKGLHNQESSLEMHGTLVVQQPKKLEGLLETLSLLDRISERVSEDRSSDLGSAGGGATTGATAQGQQGTSARDQAIAAIPDERIMRAQLAKHIEKEVQLLQKDIRRAARRAARPGAAYKLNELYARIRRLNSLLANLLEASYDVLKRLFIRVFIDNQPVL